MTEEKRRRTARDRAEGEPTRRAVDSRLSFVFALETGATRIIYTSKQTYAGPYRVFFVFSSPVSLFALVTLSSFIVFPGISLFPRDSLPEGTGQSTTRKHSSSNYATTVFCRFQNRHRFGGCCCWWPS